MNNIAYCFTVLPVIKYISCPQHQQAKQYCSMGTYVFL